VSADPEPDDDVTLDDAEYAIPEPDAGGLDGACGVHALETETSVLRVLAESAIGFTGSPLDLIR
jgi:hypothetical protein